jgi:hypothetical protein
MSNLSVSFTKKIILRITNIIAIITLIICDLTILCVTYHLGATTISNHAGKGIILITLKIVSNV